MGIIKEIESVSGFDRRPSESVSEYLTRLGTAAGVDEGEIAAVREAVHTEMYSPEPLPDERRETVESFARTVSERASPADVEADPEPEDGAGTEGGGAAAAGYGAGAGGTRGSSPGDTARASRDAGESRAEDGSVAATMEAAAARWDGASKSSRRKFLSGAGVVGVLALGGAAAGIGALGGPDDDGNATAALGNATGTANTSASAVDEDPMAETTTEEAPDEVATEPAPRASLADADVAFEEFELREYDRELWPQSVPTGCLYGVEELADLPELVYRNEGETGLDPFASARTILGVLSCYEATDDDAYLEKATEMGTALHEAGVAHDGGLFLPHEFAVEPHADLDWTVRQPWFSATTQGLALSAFSRLYVHGGDEGSWRYGVDVLRSFDSIVTRADGPAAENPWATCLDGEHLWLEKYAQLPASHVFSGHNVAAWGLYEMWAAVGSSLARDLFRASATTVKARADAFRNSGDVSDFCLGHDVQRPEYHRLHVDQLGTYHEITGDEAFAAAAERFAEDYDPSA